MDLDALEWEGEFAHDRPLIEDAYARTLDGSMVMLVAADAGAIAGQVWLDLARGHGAVHVWALRVKRSHRRRGVATRLLLSAEREAIARGFDSIVLEVAPDNAPARRLYARLGYDHVGSHRDPIGGPLLVLRKRLVTA